MPQFKQYQQQQTYNAPRLPDAPNLGIGAGVEALGRGVSDASNTYAKYVDERSNFTAQIKLDELRGELEQDALNLKNTAPEWNGPESAITEKFVEGFDKKAEKLMSEQSYTQSARDRLQMGFQKLRQQAMESGMAIDVERTKTWTKKSLQDQQNKSLNRITINPQARDQEIEAMYQTIDALPSTAVPEQVKSAEKQNWRLAAWDQSLDTSVKQLTAKKNVSIGEIDRMISDLKNEKSGWAKNTSNPAFEKAMFALQNAKEVIRTKREGESIEFFKETLAHVAETGAKNPIKREDITARISDPAKQKLMLEQWDIAENTAKASEFVKRATDDQINSEIRRLNSTIKDVNTDQYYETRATLVGLQNAMSIREKQMRDDAAGYIMRNDPTAAEMFSKYAKSGNPEDAAEYANYVAAAQKNLKPSAVPQVIPESMAMQYKEQFDSMMSDPQGATKMAASLKQLRLSFGDNFDIVANDLRRHKALTANQFVAANYSAIGGKNSLIDSLIKADMNDPEVLKKLNDEDKYKEVYAQSVQSLEDFAETFGDDPVGKEFVNNYAEAITKTVLANQGKYRASHLADELINNQYVFSDGVRYPKKVKNRPLDMDRVIDGKAYVLSDQFLDGIDLYVPPTNIRPEDAKESLKKKIRRDGVWKNYNDNGLMLVYEGDLAVERVGTKGREPLFLSWEQLEAYGVYTGLSPAANSGAVLEKQNSWRNK